ncbi:MAG: glycosyltransferase [Bacteroidia bacterium]|nr:glycosyltransferase [Bacteroidia bacterium]
MKEHSTKYNVAFSVTNCICFDQRVLKIAEVVNQLNCNITIIGRRKDHQCESVAVPFNIRRFRMIFKKGFLFYKFYNIRLFFYLLFHKSDLLVANDLDTLLPNFLVSKLKRLPLVFDSHEYFTGVPEIQNRPFVKWVWTTIEKMIFPRLKYVMTVSDSISMQYESQYGIRPVTIRNCARSFAETKGYTKKELGISGDHLLLILQGGGINIDRGGEELIEAMTLIENVSLIIVGSGDVLQFLKNKVEELNLSNRVKFIPKQPWNELLRYTKSADAGLSLDKDTNLNYRFSLPNKLFDYISAGIPVITSDLPEVKKIVKESGCGIIIQTVTPEEICKAIIKLRDDRVLLNKLKQNAVIASGTLNWDRESKKVVDFYKVIKFRNKKKPHQDS